jgi:hypothetical protein
MDGAVAVFKNTFDNTLGDEDSRSMGTSSTESVVIVNNADTLSIDGRKPVTENDTIALFTQNLTSTLPYRLRIDASTFSADGVAPYLLDSYKNTTTALSTTAINTIDFAVDANSASSNQRFSIVFKPVVLSVNSIVVNASKQAAGVVVNWNTKGEHQAATYEVERSANGVSFAKQATVAAENTATASYSYTDAQPASGNNYYRIKAIGTDKVVTYSQVVLVKVGVSAALVNVYPNPLSGNKLVVNLSGVAAGSYRVRLHNGIGQQVVNQLVQGGVEAVVTVGTLAAGNYEVSVSDTNGKQVYQTKLVVAK